ncbi:MAG: hypothetical protein MUC43_09740 [Pirellula sp.]|nr:hypothetical protein [Pirellula sp.]
MKLPVTFTVFEIVLTLILILGPMIARGDESKSRPVSDRVCAKLEALFKKHSPKATFENQGVNGIHFEHEVKTFEVPDNGPKGGKHETEKQRGPKKRGILCSVYSHSGPYVGQLALSPVTKGKVAQYLKDRKEYKQLLMVPYSKRSDVHMWVALSFPPDVDEAFLEDFRQIMTDFENDT